ncbi:helix-turn-helix DNA-binding domain protein [Mycobacterium phage XianYue]|nr:helix-turn-helix DNA-binding domain protein [Mycobacterium phage XianYue]
MEKFKELLDEVAELIDSKDQEIRNLRSLCDNRYRTIGELQGQLDVARRSFGEAFIKGDVTRGPNRPNRKKLTEADAKDIRNAYYGGAKQKDLARNYGVNPATISRLVRGLYH